MSSKSRKSLSTWVTCEKCQSVLTHKDVDQHASHCPPNNETWTHDYIRQDTLYGSIETYKPQECPKNISERDLDDMVFLSQSAMQLCNIAIGDPVILTNNGNAIVKTAWPSSDKSLTSVSLTKNAIELNNIRGPVKVCLLGSNIEIAKEFQIAAASRHSLPDAATELDVLLKNCNEQKIFSIGNKFSIPYYGKELVFEIKGVTSHSRRSQCSLPESLEKLKLSDSERNEPKFYKALYSTKWIIASTVQKDKKTKYKIEDVGGYDGLITDIRDVLDIGLSKCSSIGEFCISKGLLLYGTAGIGKSMLANALISESDVEYFNIYSSDIYSKSIGETEKRLKDIFSDARSKAPSIIFIEDIDSLCPKRSTSNTDQERRVLAQLMALFDEVQDAKENVVVLATTSKLDLVDSSLRRPGRIDREFEIFAPTPKMRGQILMKLLAKIPNDLTADEVSNISFVTHGFVGADLYGLCSQAVINAVKRNQRASIKPENPKVSLVDFNYALTVTKPSAMKEVLVEVPNVKWSDVGGQKDLKLKLKQAIEWPLRYPEAFARMGINPPRGLLMFGPPGCSKTMIAKALATESKVNFLNIKGPELFSKWVGESEKAVREVFRKARQVAPSIIFIDEIDALGGERGSSSGTGSNVQERVLAQLLTELDGITALGSVTLVAATNRPDKIDKALLRPGRLDRIIYVQLPDYETRREIFDIKLRKMPIADDVDVEDLVDLTEGYSGAEIQAICHEAAMKALEEDLNAAIITKEHFKAALSFVTPRIPPSLINLYNDYMNKVH